MFAITCTRVTRTAPASVGALGIGGAEEGVTFTEKTVRVEWIALDGPVSLLIGEERYEFSLEDARTLAGLLPTPRRTR